MTGRDGEPSPSPGSSRRRRLASRESRAPTLAEANLRRRHAGSHNAARGNRCEPPPTKAVPHTRQAPPPPCPSFPRRRESIAPPERTPIASETAAKWIPASAGMTVRDGGVVSKARSSCRRRPASQEWRTDTSQMPTCAADVMRAARKQYEAPPTAAPPTSQARAPSKPSFPRRRESTGPRERPPRCFRNRRQVDSRLRGNDGQGGGVVSKTRSSCRRRPASQEWRTDTSQMPTCAADVMRAARKQYEAPPTAAPPTRQAHPPPSRHSRAGGNPPRRRSEPPLLQEPPPNGFPPSRE